MILGQKIEILQISNMGTDLHGESDLDNHSIILNAHYAKTNKITLLHEVIHASLGIGGVSEFLTDKQEEAVCRCLEHALLDYIKFPGDEE